tara:strand:- start:1731 stop:4277 length:2547 start_codon:yes stop_codon:yes gene_type:complete
MVRTTFRHWRASIGQYLLLIAIVAVGVGAFNGIRQASRAASANFGLFNEAVSGRSDFIIESPSQRISEDTLSALGSLASYPDWHLVPVVEGSITALDEKGEPTGQLRLVGLDLLSLANLPYVAKRPIEFAEEESTWHEWLGSEKDVWLGRGTANKLNAKKGQRISILASGRVKEIFVRKILDDRDLSVSDDLVIADISTAQGLLSRKGEINRVEVVLERAELREDTEYLNGIGNRISSLLPEGLSVGPTKNRAVDRAAMTAAFRLNLTVLSLIAVLVGGYLILQALDAAVVRKREETAILRSLGVNGRILFLTGILEAVAIGILGSLAGILVGHFLAFGAVGMFAETVNALYFATSIEAISLTWKDCATGLLLGFLFSLVAGWLPARDAMQTPPAQILSKGDWSPGFLWLRNPRFGLSLIVFGALALLLPTLSIQGGSRMPIGGFLAAGAWILGSALLSGQILVCLAKFCHGFCQSPVSRLATSRLMDGSSRHRLAVAGLVVAVGMVTGMFQMVDSFRSTIQEWFDVRFQAELYVSERGVTGAGSVNGIDPALLDELLLDKSIDYADVMYVCHAKAAQGITLLAGVDFDAWTGFVRQIWLKPPGTIRPSSGAEPALVSEAFARRFDVLEGGTVELDTPKGPKLVSPIGIFSDYGNEFGTAAIAIDSWKEWTGADRPINASLYLADGSELEETKQRLRLSYPGLDVRNARELRDVALGIFEQTFKATSALNAIGLAVAFVGLLLGLFSIFDESASTWSTLRHLGFSPVQFVLSAGFEGAGIAVASLAGGTLSGLAMGWLLIFVVNVQSFGWTLLWKVPLADFLIFGLLMVLVGFLSGCLSAIHWSRRKT